MFGVFHGWQWAPVTEVDMTKLDLWFKHLREVICNDDPVKFEYINKWIAYVVQNATRSTVGLVLQGIQGAGKNAFTDILTLLFRGFSNGDITDMEDLTGNNSGIENKVLVVLNEARNAGEERFANFDKLKAYVVAPFIDISEKYVVKHKAENVLNIIFTTNNDYPIKIEKGDRRYYVLMVSGKYKHDKQNFNDYWKECSGAEFFGNLMTYYQQLDTTFNDVRDPPTTEEKEAIIDASRSPIDQFIADNFQLFLDGWKCDEARMAKPYEIKDRTFNLAISNKCSRKQRRIGSSKPYYYELKPEWIVYYRPKEDEAPDCA
jgi:phage/plasmid-associated DNA primase